MKLARIKCFFGFHDDQPLPQYDSRNKCVRCGREVIVIKVMYEDDARKMGIPEEIIQSGIITGRHLRNLRGKNE